MSLKLVPCSIREADRFVRHHHRHARPTGGKAKAAIGAEREGALVGVALIGRPKARGLDGGGSGLRLEVLRVCVHGTPEETRNACSFLYSRCRRLSAALGYDLPPQTYTLKSESGASLRAAGWCPVAELEAREGWDTPARPRSNRAEIDGQERIRWEAPA